MKRHTKGSDSRFRAHVPGFMSFTVAGALLVVPVVGWLAEALYDEREAHAAVVESIEQRVRDDLRRHGFEQAPDLASLGIESWRATASFRFELGTGVLTGGAPDGERSREVARVVEQELGRYPAGFAKKVRLRRVVFVSNLREANKSIPSLPNFEGGLLLDIVPDSPGEDAYLRRLIHHEVFHFMDYADDDQLSQDDAWTSLNDEYFVYGFGGRFERRGRSSGFGSGGPGFVSGYARSALEEDKAETFAFMMTAPAALAAQVTSDSVLAQKVATLQRAYPVLTTERR